eukprot:241938-Alexandrium_andersonii.AAC.1
MARNSGACRDEPMAAGGHWAHILGGPCAQPGRGDRSGQIDAGGGVYKDLPGPKRAPSGKAPYAASVR